MQKLLKRNTNTPLNTSPVQCNCNPALNREETLSVSDLKTFNNNSEENLLPLTGESKAEMLVYVINKNNKPLMPCTSTKARHLLNQGKAKIIEHTPFTIQLTWDCEEHTQPITLGIDPGYSYIGYSAITDTKELISGEVTLRSDIKRLLQQRASYRRTRRSRLWHRAPRFNNRSKPEGWLPPSIQHKLDSHLKLIEKLKSILPITSTVIEIATFNTQKMQNPEISGIEYQQGTLQGYEIREYLLEKFKHKCAYCNKSNISLEIEHIIPKSRGGSNRVSNLTIACHTCNQSKGNLTAEDFGHPSIQSKAKKPLRSTAFMNIVKKRLFELLIRNDKSTSYTYGYITKRNRIQFNISKSHFNDAFIIANGSTQSRSPITLSKQVRRQNRSLFKANLLKGGRLKRNTIKESNGFRRYDKVLYNKTICFIYGLRSSGYFNLKTITGTKVYASASFKKLTLLEHAKGIITEVCAIPSPDNSRDFLA